MGVPGSNPLPKTCFKSLKLKTTLRLKLKFRAFRKKNLLYIIHALYIQNFKALFTIISQREILVTHAKIALKM